MQGSFGLIRGQINLKFPMATKFSDKSPWTECNALLGSKLMQGLAEINQRSNCSEMPYSRVNFPKIRDHFFLP